MMYALNEALLLQATHLSQAAATTAASNGSGVSSLLVVAVGGMAVFVSAGIIRTALKIFQSLLGVAVRVGMFVIAIGFGTLVFAVLYLANLVFNLGPS
jgi:hypothetical protein